MPINDFFFFLSINQNEALLAIFLDFSKAFDTVDHEILLKKLEYYGFRGNFLNWVRSFLSNRTQFVEINENRSSLRDVTIGVPQGSTLGPLLFILYINDLCKSLTQLKSIHFADDTTLYINMKPSEDITNMINAELTQVQTWINANKLSLNVQKTNYMIISNRRAVDDIDINLGGEAITRVSQHKFLGVIIDDKLKFGGHINSLCNKISQSIGIMKRISHLVPVKILKILYYTLIYSRLTYAITAWGSSFPTTLRRLQSRVRKAISMIMPQAHSESDLLDYQGIYKYFLLSKMYMIVNKRKHIYFTRKIDELRITHHHRTRSNEDNQLTLPRYSYRKCQNSFLFRSVKIWNTLPNAIRSAIRLRKFKK